MLLVRWLNNTPSFTVRMEGGSPTRKAILKCI